MVVCNRERVSQDGRPGLLLLLFEFDVCDGNRGVSGGLVAEQLWAVVVFRPRDARRMLGT